jgi:hypothetical protein
MRKMGGALLVVLLLGGSAGAQTGAWKFQWPQGQTLYYRVEHQTYVSEVVGGNKVETRSKVNLVRGWKVTAVDAQGVATLEMSITAMRHEQLRPNGDIMVYDSRDPEKSTPALREQLEKYLRKPVAVLRVDTFGRVVEVLQGPPNRYQAELPFAICLAGGPITAGQAWDRDYAIVLDPPLGTGEKYAAAQKYTCTKIEGGLASVSLATSIAKMPEAKADQLPLLQRLPQGEVVFDVQHGRLQSARLVIDREVRGHQGEGSSYLFQSTYTEQYAEK